MKLILLSAAVATTSLLSAQITVNEQDVAIPGDVVIQNSDTIPSVSVPTTGTNQTWNYSSLVAHEEDTMNFGLPAWLNNGAFFPSSNLAATQGSNTDFEMYLEKNSTGLWMLGIAADFLGTGSPQVIKVNPADLIIQFPANYGDVYTNSAVQRFSFNGADVGAPFDSIVNKTYTDKAFSVDGWGALTTPMGTFDALRLNQDITETDSTWGYLFGMEQLLDNGMDTRTTVAMWTNDPSARFPLMEVEVDDLGNVVNVTWLKATPQVGVEELSSNTNFTIYPNPAKTIVNVEQDELMASELIVHAMDGAIVLSSQLNSASNAIDISELNSGVYFFKLIDESNNNLFVQRIVVK